MSESRPTHSGLAPAQPLVTTTGLPATRADALDRSNPRPDPSRLSPDAPGSSPSHPALNALARLLARQISRSGGADG
jgi:hypothetical protein